jgi:hypothetical protein
MRIDQMHYNFELELDRVASNDRPDFMPWEIDEYLNKAIWKFVKTRYGINQNKFGFETNQKRIDELSSLHIKSPELQPAVTPINLGNGRWEVRLNSLGNNINGQFFRYLFLTAAEVVIKKGDCTKKIRHTQWQMDDRKTMFSESSWKWNRILANFGRSTFITTPDNNPNNLDRPYATSDLIVNDGLITEKFNNDELRSLYFDATNYEGEEQFILESVYINYIKYPNRVFFGGYDHIDKHSINTNDPVHCDIDESFHPEIVRLAVDYAQQDIQDQFGVQLSAKKTTEDFQI